jgi:hypothetical protein
MKTYYHVTPKENLSSVMKYGLIPQVGEWSKELNEGKAVFLFPTEADMEDALQNWLGDCFNEDDELVSLEITLPDNFPIQNSTVDWEKISKSVIPPQYIHYLQEV